MWFLFWFWFWFIIAWFTSTRTLWQNGDNLNEDNLKNEDDLKVGDNLQNEAELRSPQCLWFLWWWLWLKPNPVFHVGPWSDLKTWPKTKFINAIFHTYVYICSSLFSQLKLTENTQKSAISSSYYFTGGRCLGWSHLLLLLSFCHFILFLYFFVWLLSMRSSL